MYPEEKTRKEQVGVISQMKVWKGILAKGISTCGGPEAGVDLQASVYTCSARRRLGAVSDMEQILRKSVHLPPCRPSVWAQAFLPFSLAPESLLTFTPACCSGLSCPACSRFTELFQVNDREGWRGGALEAVSREVNRTEL